ncbi:hypothetical protein DAPPUDRAFT_271232 [Daphnia pulex]|uniref:Uncharacterized protein n=1 Tax=Daphnia pulex TaxID=6669 RepID=E9I1X2_DAPPU|nr:hypothetical protein DAPPUDRAFT_271232 [Daphnia pulex]|eukprot:EFX62008.1 hypothetical protein DAPPUDRAFT_271232 [Daphnia pulex]
MERRKLLKLSDNLMNMEFVGKREKKQARIKDYGEYSVKHGLDDFVLIMMRNDKEDMDSGVGLTEIA